MSRISSSMTSAFPRYAGGPGGPGRRCEKLTAKMMRTRRTTAPTTMSRIAVEESPPFVVVDAGDGDV